MKNFTRKLFLNKVTISNLNAYSMKKIVGAADSGNAAGYTEVNGPVGTSGICLQNNYITITYNCPPHLHTIGPCNG